jgi:hypothetical protein
MHPNHAMQRIATRFENSLSMTATFHCTLGSLSVAIR